MARTGRGSLISCRNMAAAAGDLTVLQGVCTENFNHGPAKLFSNTGSFRGGRPAMGAWVTYGIGSESKNMPGFVVLQSGPRGPRGGAALWGSGFLPTAYQGIPFRVVGDPILDLSTPKGVGGEEQRQTLDAIRDLNQMRFDATGDEEITTRISQYEMAYRMQIERTGADRFEQGNRTDDRNVRRGTGQAARMRTTVCWRGGWWNAACGSCSCITPTGTITTDLTSRWTRSCQEVDQATAALITRPEAARTAGDDAGDLGRRVRPHADGRGAGKGQDRPQSPHRCVHAVDGRRRHQSRASRWAIPTSLASHPAKSRSMSTICTRRFCTCSASTTRS